MRVGARLRDLASPRLSWRDLLVVVACRPDDSPLARVLRGDCGHTDAEHVDMYQLHLLAVANWQRGDGKKHKAPKPIDCLLPAEERATTRYAGASMTLDEAADWLGWELELAGDR